VFLLRDLCELVNAQGLGRFGGYGWLNAKDIANTSTLVDTLVRYLIENNKMLIESKNSLPIPRLQKGCFKIAERVELFKQKFQNSDSNPLSFLPSLDQIASTNEYQQDDSIIMTTTREAISTVCSFVMNYCSHLAFDSGALQ
jgi:hypothetical protein